MSDYRGMDGLHGDDASGMESYRYRVRTMAYRSLLIVVDPAVGQVFGDLLNRPPPELESAASRYFHSAHPGMCPAGQEAARAITGRGGTWRFWNTRTSVGAALHKDDRLVVSIYGGDPHVFVVPGVLMSAMDANGLGWAPDALEMMAPVGHGSFPLGSHYYVTPGGCRVAWQMDRVL